MANKKPKEADEREICQPVEEVENPIAGAIKPVPQTGAIIEPPHPDDYIAGADSTEVADRMLDSNWSKYKSRGEKQHAINWEFDSMSCVSFGANREIEPQLNYFLEGNRMPAEAKQFLYDHGYIVDGKVNLSDKFLAIKSKTTKYGNKWTVVADALKKCGAIPESMLPFGNAKTWEEYHNPAQITKEMEELGKQFALHFSIVYSWVITQGSRPLTDEQREYMYSQLRQAPIQRLADGHSTSFYAGIHKQKWLELEHYEPFEQEKPWTFDPPYVGKIIIEPRGQYTTEQIMTARQLVKQIIINQHGKQYFFRSEKENGAHGECYKVEIDGSFKYGTAKGTIFTEMTKPGGPIIPVSEELFKQFKPAEIK